MLPKYNFFHNNQSGFEEGQLVSSDQVGNKLPQKLQSDFKPLHLCPSQNQKSEKFETFENLVDIKRTTKNDRQTIENSKKIPNYVSNGFDNQIPQTTQKQMKKNNSFQIQKQYVNDNYHNIYGDERNQICDTLKNGQYRPNCRVYSKDGPLMKSPDIYSTYFQYPYNYDMYRPHPFPPCLKMGQNKIRQQSKQNLQKNSIKKNKVENLEQKDRIQIEQEEQDQVDSKKKQKIVNQVKMTIQQILNNFNKFDRELLLQIFDDILSNKDLGPENLWNFIDKFKGKHKQQKGQLIFDILDILKLDKVMYQMREIQERQKQQKLQNGSRIKKLLYSLVIPVNPI